MGVSKRKIKLRLLETRHRTDRPISSHHQEGSLLPLSAVSIAQMPMLPKGQWPMHTSILKRENAPDAGAHSPVANRHCSIVFAVGGGQVCTKIAPFVFRIHSSSTMVISFVRINLLDSTTTSQRYGLGVNLHCVRPQDVTSIA